VYTITLAGSRRSKRVEPKRPSKVVCSTSAVTLVPREKKKEEKASGVPKAALDFSLPLRIPKV
jgi:hypothetical protein